jgi:hypothetical protein
MTVRTLPLHGALESSSELDAGRLDLTPVIMNHPAVARSKRYSQASRRTRS